MLATPTAPTRRATAHRLELPADEDLTEELTAVRLRKNSLGIYRLDHDTSGHDDQAIALALGVVWLLDTPQGPQFPILDAPDEAAPVSAVVEYLGQEVLIERGRIAYRQADMYAGQDEAADWDEPAAAAAIDVWGGVTGSDGVRRGAVRTVGRTG